MEKIFAFQKDKRKVELLLLLIDRRKVSVVDYREYTIEEESKEKIFELFKSFLLHNKASSVKTVCFLSSSSFYLRRISFPYRGISKIRKSIKFAIEPYIPHPAEDVEVFFHPLGEKSGNFEVLSFAIPKALLEEQIELVNSLKLSCQELYPVPLSLFNFFVSHLQENKNILWVDVGGESTYLFRIGRGKKLLDLKEVPLGKNNLDEGRKELKREIDIMILSEELYKKQKEDINEICITGVSDIPEVLDKDLPVPVRGIDWQNFILIEKSDSISTPQLLYATLGRGGPLAVNFYPPTLGEREKRGILATGILTAVALLIFSSQLYLQWSNLDRKFTSLNSEIEEIFLQTFPEVKDTRAPFLQMKSRIKSLKETIADSNLSSSKRISPLEVLREISHLIGENLPVELYSFSVKEGIVTISGNTQSYQNVGKIKESLENSTLFSTVEIKSAESKTKGVQFRLEIRLLPKNEIKGKL